MKFDYTVTFQTPNGERFQHQKVKMDAGKPVMHANEKGEKVPVLQDEDLTLREVILICAQNRLEGDEKMTPLEVVNVGTAGLAVVRGNELSTEQVALLKERAARFFQNPYLVALIHEAMDRPLPKVEEPPSQA